MLKTIDFDVLWNLTVWIVYKMFRRKYTLPTCSLTHLQVAYRDLKTDTLPI